jgi:hypothetical protein
MGTCKLCLEERPTAPVAFGQHIGVVLVRFHRKFDGELCKPCAGTVFGQFTSTTLLLGWWGLLSCVITPVVLLQNVVSYSQARHKLRGQDESPNSALVQQPRFQQPSMLNSWLKVGAFVLIVSCISAYFGWRQLEPYAPGVNKVLHSGASSESDADYHVAKLNEAQDRYSVALATTEGQSNAAYRKQVLTQGQAALTSMEYEVSKLKAAAAADRTKTTCTSQTMNVVSAEEAFNINAEILLAAVRHNDHPALNAALPLGDAASDNVNKALAALRACK